MPPRVTLTVTSGKTERKQYTFTENTSCYLGRQSPKDCLIFSQEGSVSRLHAMLEVALPRVQIRDFGSLNGTYVNGTKIGSRRPHETVDEGRKRTYPERMLNDGDELRLGTALTMKVSIYVPAYCADCQSEILEDQKSASESAPGVFECADCRHKTRPRHEAFPQHAEAPGCSGCGRNISVEMEGMAGEYICRACRAKLQLVIEEIVAHGRPGQAAQQVLDRYAIVRELGRGGNGIVFLAKDNRNGENVAIKVMVPELVLDPKSKSYFEREILNLRVLQHPNIVSIREAVTTNGMFFFVMEYCSGGDLIQRMQQTGGTFHPVEAVALILQALEGMVFAHDVDIPNVLLKDGAYGPGKGLVHRDIKPNNLFLCGTARSPLVKVGDWGMSKSFTNAGLTGFSRTGQASGTPQFMPRIQAVKFKYAKPEVDVWALAATLYFLLTGTTPRRFPESQDPWHVILDRDPRTGQLKYPPVPIRRHIPGLHGALADLVDEALIDHPEIRIKTALEFRRRLENAL